MNPVLVNVVSPPHFSLPEDPTTPVVMFAGGTGKSTVSSPVCSVRIHNHFGLNPHSDTEHYSNERRRALSEVSEKEFAAEVKGVN
jgi:hypothetical protein